MDQKTKGQPPADDVHAWFVDAYVCGHPSGSYPHNCETAAEADAADRRRRFSVLGCSYRVRDAIPIIDAAMVSADNFLTDTEK